LISDGTGANQIDTTGGAVAHVVLADTVTTYTGNTPQTGDSYARIGAAGAGLTNIDLPNQTMDIAGTITTATNVTNIVTANVTQMSGDATAADNIETAYDDTAGSVPWEVIVDQGTAQSATGTTLVLRAAASFADNALNGATITIISATAGAGQSKQIASYVGSSDTATVSTWATTPTGTIVYKIKGTAPTLAAVDLDSATGSLSPTQFEAGTIFVKSFTVTAGSVANTVVSTSGLTETSINAFVGMYVSCSTHGYSEVYEVSSFDPALDTISISPKPTGGHLWSANPATSDICVITR
jgi:hypothetical protein